MSIFSLVQVEFAVCPNLACPTTSKHRQVYGTLKVFNFPQVALLFHCTLDIKFCIMTKIQNTSLTKRFIDFIILLKLKL